MKLVGYRYVRADEFLAKYFDEVFDLEARGYRRGPKSSRGIHMVKPCEAWITLEDEDGRRNTQDVRNEVCRFYNKKMLKLERFNAFIVDLLTEKVQIMIDEEGTFRIKNKI